MKAMWTAWRREARLALSCSAVIAASFWLAWLLRFEFRIPVQERTQFWQGLMAAWLVKGLVFLLFRLRLDQWCRYVCFTDLVYLLKANVAASVAASLAWFALLGPAFPRSIYVLDFLLCVSLSGGVRFLARLFAEAGAARRSRPGKGLLIYGAGVAGMALAREVRGNKSLGYELLGFLDDDPRKLGARLMGSPVLGSGNEAGKIVAKLSGRGTPVEEIVVAMPSATAAQIREAVGRGQAAGVRCRIVPGLGDLISGKLPISELREISVTELLEREPVEMDSENVRRAVAGHSVLVTGAAGSIGSELCHQLARLEPRRLVAFDQAENELFRLEGELRGRYPELKLAIEVGDIRDAARLEQVFSEHDVNAVFHAAAYKHVPLMERQIGEAVRNNVLGTWNLIQTAWRSQVARFVMISTDKAVNPSSVMGLTKRVAELIVTATRPPLGSAPTTRCVCVRFGNVLVSNGSVVPIFQRQIARGGPITVTHPEMRRYFMTVQEAVQLVLQASTMGQDSEIFVLDMGQPVRIVDLARKMITLAGLRPGQDIEIRFVGVRPGEKLFEELSLEAENLLATSHPKIRVFQGRRIAFESLVPWMAELQYLLWRGDAAALLEHLRQLVPEYRPCAVAAGAEAEGRREAAAPRKAQLARAVPTAAS